MSSTHIHANGGGTVADTAIVEPTAYVGPNARVLDEAYVLDTARICGNAVVSGTAQVCNGSMVSGHALVTGHALISDSKVYGDAIIVQEAQVDHSTVRGTAFIGGGEWILRETVEDTRLGAWAPPTEDEGGMPVVSLVEATRLAHESMASR